MATELKGNNPNVQVSGGLILKILVKKRKKQNTMARGAFMAYMIPDDGE